MVLLPKGLKALKQVAQQVGVDLRGADLHREGGVDATPQRKCLFNAGMIPHIQENPRHRKTTKRGRKRFFNGEYCLSNHIECEDLSDVPMNPEPGKQRHGQLHHVLGLGDNDRLPFEAAKPMPLAAMIPLDPIRPGFAHDQSLGWDHRGLHRPRISPVERHLPLDQAIDQLLQGCRITTPTLPVKEAACITIKSLPDPELAPFFLRKCHISSISRMIAFPLGAGFSAWSAA
jgi:hypothetical protein